MSEVCRKAGISKA